MDSLAGSSSLGLDLRRPVLVQKLRLDRSIPLGRQAQRLAERSLGSSSLVVRKPSGKGRLSSLGRTLI